MFRDKYDAADQQEGAFRGKVSSGDTDNADMKLATILFFFDSDLILKLNLPVSLSVLMLIFDGIFVKI